MHHNLYNPAVLKKPTEFNSQTSFCDTAAEVERQDRERTEQRISDMIQATKDNLADEN